jgi:hypothetical protein
LVDIWERAAPMLAEFEKHVTRSAAVVGSEQLL